MNQERPSKPSHREIKSHKTQMAGSSNNPSSNSGKMLTPQTTFSGKTFTGVGNLIKLLPTGTVFLFQFLSPVLTNNGQCHTINKYLAGVLLGVCGFSCVFSSFTDSYTGSDGMTHYGIATVKGLWPSPDSGSVDLSTYKLRLGDFVHGFLALVVFAVLAFLDPNTVECYYPSFESTQKMLLMVLPPVAGVVSSSVSMMFPNNRHGIGYPPSPASKDS